MRPLQETGVTQSSSANQRLPRGAGPSSSGGPLQHTTETRKQMQRLVPSVSKPPVNADSSRKEGPRRPKKAVSTGRREQRPSERAGAQGTSGRANPTSKPKVSRSRKKIV
jgi:hypothetical protein